MKNVSDNKSPNVPSERIIKIYFERNEKISKKKVTTI